MKILPTLRQLRYLVAVADHLHFGRAAETCLVTQSTLSAGLRELENLLGVTLVERSRRRVVLTAIGGDIVERARRLLRDAEDLVDAASAGTSPLTGALRLGVIPTVGPYLLPQAVPALKRDYPGLKLYLREDRTAQLLALLSAGELDAALIALPFATGDLVTLPLASDRLLLACPRGHPLAGRAEIGEADLNEAPLLLLEDGHCMRDHAIQACRLSGDHRNEVFQATSMSTLVQMVAAGMGVTLLPEIGVAVETERQPDIAVVPLGGARPTRRIALVWRRGSPRDGDFRLLGAALAAYLPDGTSPPSPQVN